MLATPSGPSLGEKEGPQRQLPVSPPPEEDHARSPAGSPCPGTSQPLPMQPSWSPPFRPSGLEALTGPSGPRGASPREGTAQKAPPALRLGPATPRPPYLSSCLGQAFPKTHQGDVAAANISQTPVLCGWAGLESKLALKRMNM